MLTWKSVGQIVRHVRKDWKRRPSICSSASRRSSSRNDLAQWYQRLRGVLGPTQARWWELEFHDCRLSRLGRTKIGLRGNFRTRLQFDLNYRDWAWRRCLQTNVIAQSVGQKWMDRPLVWLFSNLDTEIKETAEFDCRRRRSFLHLIFGLYLALRDDLNLLWFLKGLPSLYDHTRLFLDKEAEFEIWTETNNQQERKLHDFCDPAGQPAWQGTVEDWHFWAYSYQDHSKKFR